LADKQTEIAENKPVRIISDNPEKASKLFGFDAYAKTLAELIANKENTTPLVIGIYGEWGSGKTTLMKTIIGQLKEIEKEDNKALYRSCKTVWFSPWKYQEENSILAALIEEIFKTMSRDDFFSQCKGALEKLTKMLNKLQLVGELSKTLSGGSIDISAVFAELPHKEKLGFYDTFQNAFDDLIWTYLQWRPKKTTQEKLNDKKGALVIFIDDLDPCPKEKILKVLETIKLFMDKEGCIFVIGAANDIIEKGLKETYGEDANLFMDKIVQVTFNLPQISLEDCESYIENISPQSKEAILPHLKIITSAVKKNPRRLKRFLNNLSLQEGLFKNRKKAVTYTHLLYWNIIDYAYPKLSGLIKENPQTLYTLKENIEKIDSTVTNQARWEISKDELDKVPDGLQLYIQKKELVAIIRQFNVEQAALNELFTSSTVVESLEEAKEKSETGEMETSVRLNKMVKVPAGPFIYGEEQDHKETIDKAFEIDIYPVTNSVYCAFLNQVKPDQKTLELWIDLDGRFEKERCRIIKEEDRYEVMENYEDHPLIYVSWYGAKAYADAKSLALPTELQWEKAARGEQGREYPWEGKFDKEKCNTRESKIGGTSRVDLFPNGISPYGCYDMAGNVWEWTSGNDNKMLRGGSWYVTQDNARCADRDNSRPVFRGGSIGFRCVRTLK